MAAAATAAEVVAAAKVAGAPDRPVGAGASVAAKAARRRRRRACRTGQLCVPKTKAKEAAKTRRENCRTRTRMLSHTPGRIASIDLGRRTTAGADLELEQAGSRKRSVRLCHRDMLGAAARTTLSANAPRSTVVSLAPAADAARGRALVRAASHVCLCVVSVTGLRSRFPRAAACCGTSSRELCKRQAPLVGPRPHRRNAC